MLFYGVTVITLICFLTNVYVKLIPLSRLFVSFETRARR